MLPRERQQGIKDQAVATRQTKGRAGMPRRNNRDAFQLHRRDAFLCVCGFGSQRVFSWSKQTNRQTDRQTDD